MKAKLLEIEAYTITETAKLLGYKSTKTIYRLLDRGVLEDYIWLEYPNMLGRQKIYLIQDPPNLPSLAEKIRKNIQFKKSNVIKKGANK